MKVAISGASGFIGSALIPFLKNCGYEVKKLKRGEVDLEGIDILINLSGESIVGFWSESKKEKIIKSRVETARALADAIAKMKNPPKLFINASAIGYYGSRNQETLTEKSAPGKGFLADVVIRWEEALTPAIKKGVRTVAARFGVVLGGQGGMLKQLLLPFKLGLGGKLGSGEQFMSWITIDDLLGAILHLIQHEELNGAVNFVTPFPVKNREFTEILGKILQRPTFITIPEWFIKNILGEMGKEMLLTSEKVEPEKLIASHYPFVYPRLNEALRHILE